MIIAMLAVGFMAHAQTSTTSASSSQTSGESTAKITDLQKKDEQMKDTDEEITNAKLRAEMGSKSRWSMRSSVNYYGGTIQKAFSENRPNITAGANTATTAFMSADVAAKYRTTDRTSLNLGVGIHVDTPFHRTFNEVTNSDTKSAHAGTGKLTSISNPYLEWNYAGKALGGQNFLQVSYTQMTEDFYVNTVGQTGQPSVSDQLVYELGNNSLGIAATIYTDMYKNSDKTYTYNGAPQDREESGWYAVPFYEYAFNDKYNFRTVFNWFNFSKSLKDNQYRQVVPQQSLGLGISVTRDFFLYPNIQFIPQDIRSDRTNVAVSANINLF
jgi:hypothetical protein